VRGEELGDAGPRDDGLYGAGLAGLLFAGGGDDAGGIGGGLDGGGGFAERFENPEAGGGVLQPVAGPDVAHAVGLPGGEPGAMAEVGDDVDALAAFEGEVGAVEPPAMGFLRAVGFEGVGDGVVGAGVGEEESGVEGGEVVLRGGRGGGGEGGGEEEKQCGGDGTEAAHAGGRV